MASIRKRGLSWQAQVRREGYPPICKTFRSKADATLWARDLERSIDRADLPVTTRDLKAVTLAELLGRYEQEVTSRKRGARFERSRLRLLQGSDLGKMTLDKIKGAAVAAYRDTRLAAVKPASVRRELVILRHCFEVARREWGLPLRENPVAQIKIPQDARPREHRLADTDRESIQKALCPRSAWYLLPLITLAVETGMRRGELLSVLWADVDLEKRTLRVLKTKNGHPRTIPLTPKAIEVLAELPRTSDRIFPVTPNAVRLAWERLRRRAGIKGLRFHDLRHEAVSRFFEMGLTTPEVALISGHRDPRMLLRYTHLRPEAVAQKLAEAQGRG